MSQAQGKDLVGDYAWTFNSNSRSFEPVHGTADLPSVHRNQKPWWAYWVYTVKDTCALVIPQTPARTTAKAKGGEVPMVTWSLVFTVDDREKRSDLTEGVGPEAVRLMSPPAMPDTTLQSYFSRQDRSSRRTSARPGTRCSGRW